MKKTACYGILLVLLLLPFTAKAVSQNENEVYNLLNENGEEITLYGGTPEVEDEYISGDNGHYQVIKVNSQEKTAILKRLGEYDMPKVDWEDQDSTLPVMAMKKAVALYCTHSDESYEPGDGSSSKEQRGGIYDVAEKLKAALEKKGVAVYYSDENHYPHDAGAYRRSRSTAASLAKEGVDAIFDIHRDGIPDASQYESQVAGDDVTKVRLLVGRSNQNASANKQFAARLKAVADKVYPGLIKDIYIGKGTYNQDLMSQAVLLEFGTHKSEKNEVLASTAYMADVINRTLYGGVTGAAKETEKKEDAAGWKSALWVLGLFAAGILVYSLISTGSLSGAGTKLKRQFQEMTGGITGKKDDPE